MLMELENSTDLIRAATQKLVEVTKLNEQIAQHLGILFHSIIDLIGTQHETIQNLFDEAGRNTGMIHDANSSLTTAKKYFEDSGRMIFIFLLISSFVLLFLDYYYSPSN